MDLACMMGGWHEHLKNERKISPGLESSISYHDPREQIKINEDSTLFDKKKT